MPHYRAFATLTILAQFLAATMAWGKPATEVFENVSPSVVVVFALDKAGKVTSQGSGVVIERGVIATNCHVLEGGVTYAVEHKKSRHPAQLRHADWDRDVCSLSAAGVTAPAVPLGSTRNLKVGQKVYAVGAPKGLELTLSEGIISSLRDMGGGSRHLQITAPISPGSSGGGLFDEEGRLIGLPTYYLAEGQQLNFAVPVEFVQQLPQRQAADTAAKPKGTSSTDWLNRAIALEEKKDWPAMQQHAMGWTRAQPRNSIAWFGLGLAYNQQDQTAKAIEAFQQALRIDPQLALAWFGLGVAYGQQGQTAKEIEAYQQALRIDPQ
ncbi:tetratricopeptide repeat protein, partial [Candidatus Kaiserbacteria bacterium]|nr:tetratricopeptide repeat protein [Candidatus Kaiserbacteria bacterium]